MTRQFHVEAVAVFYQGCQPGLENKTGTDKN